MINSQWFREITQVSELEASVDVLKEVSCPGPKKESEGRQLSTQELRFTFSQNSSQGLGLMCIH